MNHGQEEPSRLIQPHFVDPVSGCECYCPVPGSNFIKGLPNGKTIDQEWLAAQ